MFQVFEYEVSVHCIFQSYSHSHLCECHLNRESRVQNDGHNSESATAIGVLLRCTPGIVLIELKVCHDNFILCNFILYNGMFVVYL